VIGPLTDPTAYGGRAEDAFHLVLPTYPGYGFSGKPQGTDWGPLHVAQAWHELMGRLGYKEYVSQGGDWGAIISEVMAVQAPAGLLGIHINMPGTVPPSIVKLVATASRYPRVLRGGEGRVRLPRLLLQQGLRLCCHDEYPSQTIGYSLADSPAGMAAFFYDKFTEWTYSGKNPEKSLTKDEMLDDITLYWLTNTGTSSSRSYWDAAQLGGGPFTAIDIPKVPVA
jgi:pimeloyl-ACP methyl ester carboxylesterase